MIEWLVYFVEWVRFILRHPRDVALGQHVDRLLYRGKRAPNPIMARRYIALMVDREHAQRHRETLTRAGH